MSDVETLALEHRRRHQERVLAYRACFRTEAGAAVLTDLVERYNPDRARYTNETLRLPHPELTAALVDGQSQVVAHIQRLLSSEIPGDLETEKGRSPEVITE